MTSFLISINIISISTALCMSLNVESCCGFHRSHSEAGHVVPCLCRRPQGVRSPHRPEPDQFVVPWTHTVGERHVFKLTYSKREMMNDKWIVGSSYIGGSYSSCSVQIRVVKLSDAGEYHFRFETDQPLGRWTSPDTITLDVTGRAAAACQPPASVSVSMCVCVFQTSRFRCIQRGPPTCLASERLCL